MKISLHSNKDTTFTLSGNKLTSGDREGRACEGKITTRLPKGPGEVMEEVIQGNTRQTRFTPTLTSLVQSIAKSARWRDRH